MRIRYTGPHPLAIMVLGIEAIPDTDFDVPDDVAELLLKREDFVLSVDPPAEKPSTRPRKVAASNPKESFTDSESQTSDQESGTDTSAE